MRQLECDIFLPVPFIRTSHLSVEGFKGVLTPMQQSQLQTAPAAVAVSVRFGPRSVSCRWSGRHGATQVMWSLRCSAACTCGSQCRVYGRRWMKLYLRRGRWRKAVCSCRNVSGTYRHRQYIITNSVPMIITIWHVARLCIIIHYTLAPCGTDSQLFANDVSAKFKVTW